MLTKDYWKRSVADYPRVNPAATGEARLEYAVAAVAFWLCYGTWQKGAKGYRARASAPQSRMLAPLLILGGKLNYVPKGGRKGYWQWTVTRKREVLWLDRQMTALFLPPLPQPDRSICRHCGQEDGFHDQECQDAPGE